MKRQMSLTPSTPVTLAQLLKYVKAGIKHDKSVLIEHAVALAEMVGLKLFFESGARCNPLPPRFIRPQRFGNIDPIIARAEQLLKEQERQAQAK